MGVTQGDENHGGLPTTPSCKMMLPCSFLLPKSTDLRVCEGDVPSLNYGRNVVEFDTFVNSVLFSIKYPFHGGKMNMWGKFLDSFPFIFQGYKHVKGFLMPIKTLAALLTWPRWEDKLEKSKKKFLRGCVYYASILFFFPGTEYSYICYILKESCHSTKSTKSYLKG